MTDLFTGIDIVENIRIERACKRYGDRFLKKIYFDSEIQYCKKKINKYECLAVRFAAKEATIKAVNLAFGVNLSFKEIEVKGKENSPAEILLHLKDKNKKLLNKPFKIRISLSHEKNYSVAIAVIIIV
ncbi:MAG: holo-[acyl-carrier-protein] synthase [Aquificae bacterium]|nr:holo-[acyl-carrier-protein] synthase [Aquificota bacterium]